MEEIDILYCNLNKEKSTGTGIDSLHQQPVVFRVVNSVIIYSIFFVFRK